MFAATLDGLAPFPQLGHGPTLLGLKSLPLRAAFLLGRPPSFGQLALKFSGFGSRTGQSGFGLVKLSLPGLQGLGLAPKRFFAGAQFAARRWGIRLDPGRPSLGLLPSLVQLTAALVQFHLALAQPEPGGPGIAIELGNLGVDLGLAMIELPLALAELRGQLAGLRADLLHSRLVRRGFFRRGVARCPRGLRLLADLVRCVDPSSGWYLLCLPGGCLLATFSG